MGPLDVNRAIARGVTQRGMAPDDLIGVLQFRATPYNDFNTGLTINVDGGKTTW